MLLVARVTDKTRHWRAALTAVLVACCALCAFSGTATSTMAPSEVTLRLEPLKAAVKEGEEIGMLVVFVGGAHETTLILPLGAGPDRVDHLSGDRGRLRTAMDGGKPRPAEFRRGHPSARPRRRAARTAPRCARVQKSRLILPP